MKIVDFRERNTLYRITKEKVVEMDMKTNEYAKNHLLRHNFLDVEKIFKEFPNAVFGIWLSDVECSLCWTVWADGYKIIDLTKGQRSE